MKKYPKISTTLLGAMKREGFSVKEMSESTGIPYPTFIRRLSNPGGWRLYELQGIFRQISLNQSEREEIRKEVMNV